jgi:hypothetical protein
VCQILEVRDEWNILKCKNFHYTSNSLEIFSEFTFSLDKNPSGEYEGPGIL